LSLRLLTLLRQPTILAVLGILIFVLVALAFIPLAGIEDDEALLASGRYVHDGFALNIELFGHRIPVMLMSYVGALKSWVYAGIFLVWKPSAMSLRLPAILIGGITIWLFFQLLRRVAGNLAAAVGCILLSTDTIFLLTTCFDWGPVVLQHFLTVSSVLCLVRFHQEGKRRFLCAGFFFFGLGMWDKALFANR
jgi:hypothetical protein